jgi:hypothetical protein
LKRVVLARDGGDGEQHTFLKQTKMSSKQSFDDPPESPSLARQAAAASSSGSSSMPSVLSSTNLFSMDDDEQSSDQGSPRAINSNPVKKVLSALLKYILMAMRFVDSFFAHYCDFDVLCEFFALHQLRLV